MATSTSRKSAVWVVTAVIAGIIIFTGFLVFRPGDDTPDLGTGQQHDSVPAPATYGQVTRQVKVGPTDSLFTFAEYGREIEKNLPRKVWIYPKGGSVYVEPPCGAPYVDTPGVDQPDRGCPAGKWKWRPEDPSATGVQVIMWP
mgnify:CR=1 FL=1